MSAQDLPDGSCHDCGAEPGCHHRDDCPVFREWARENGPLHTSRGMSLNEAMAVQTLLRHALKRNVPGIAMPTDAEAREAAVLLSRAALRVIGLGISPSIILREYPPVMTTNVPIETPSVLGGG